MTSAAWLGHSTPLNNIYFEQLARYKGTLPFKGVQQWHHAALAFIS
jgi:hypothetical protein